MKFGPFILVLILWTGLSGCAQDGDFQTDPLCAACVKRVCEGQTDGFEAHFNRLKSSDRAQIVAQMESHPGCVDRMPWAAPFVEDAYRVYGMAFYEPAQPWLKARGMRAFEELAADTTNAPYALDYLKRHIKAWRGETWAREKLEALRVRVENDEIFSLLAQAGDRGLLASLCEMAPTPARDGALIVRWPELPEEARRRALGVWVRGRWSMQASGSAQLPQYLALDVMRRPLPENAPEFVVSLRTEYVRIQNEAVQRRGAHAVDAFAMAPLRKAGSAHVRFDLQPWLTKVGNFRVSAKAVLDVWPSDVDVACLDAKNEDAQNCAPLASFDVVMDKGYRVYSGVDTGAPLRQKSENENRRASQSIRISLCNESRCMPLWRGARVVPKNGDVLEVEQGHDFYVEAHFNDSPLAVASRLMARAGDGREWREIATFYGNAPLHYDVPARGEVDLGDLCGEIGRCSLQFQLRPSLRMARRNPSITRYWGSTLDLGVFELDIQNLSARQMWSLQE